MYRVRAKPKTLTLPRLWTLLNDGTISNQEPDGREIVASMRRATLNEGTVEWTETCYCQPPLKHEKSTIYDQFFSDIEVQPQTGPANMTGTLFWQYLQQMFDETLKIGSSGTGSTGLRHIPLRLL